MSRALLGLLLALNLGRLHAFDLVKPEPLPPLRAFEDANKLYEQGKFSEAAAAYETILQADGASPALCFNLGNAHFKSGQTGRALAAYRQAERLAPRDPDLRANLQFARNQVQGPTLRAPRWQRALATLSVNEWTTLTSLALWLTFLLLAATQLRPAWKPALRTYAGACGGAAIVLGGCLALALASRASPTAVVTGREVVVHNGPLEESPSAFTAHDGAELRVLDTKEDWLQVSAGPRRNGWLKRADVMLLKNL